MGNSEALKYQVKKAYRPQIRFWFCLDLVSDEEISRFLFYPNQFPTNYRLIPSLFFFEKSKPNLITRVEDSYFNWKTWMLLWFYFWLLPPANARGLGCHLFRLPLKNKRNSVPSDLAQQAPDVTDFVVMLQAPLTPL